MNIVVIDNDLKFCDSLSRYLKSSGNLESLNTFHTNIDAIHFIETHKEKLDFIMFDFDTTDINELIEKIPKTCNLIAFASEKHIFQKYVNSPHYQRFFEKPVSFPALLSYLDSKNTTEAMEDFKNFFLQTLSELGFNLKHSGTTYLLEGTIYAIKNRTKKLSNIYEFLAITYNTTSKIIGWSINNAINRAVKNGNEKDIQSFFRIYDNRKLSAKYIINYFVNSNSLAL